MRDFAYLKRFAKQEELEAAAKKAAFDGHGLIAPTHCVVKNGEVVGHFSIAGLPVWFGHLSTTDMLPRDTFNVINTVENLVDLGGSKVVMSIAAPTSPLHKHFSSMGYRKVAEGVDLFIKEF